ncbi:MAG: efflux RND transporter periplasmic adaptor subunit [Burkholderiales bacterium]
MSKTKVIAAVFLFASILVLTAWLAYVAGVRGKDSIAPNENAAPVADSTSSAQNEERKPLYWHDPMYPQQKFDKPGKSPFMDMQLVPVYEEGADEEGTVSIDPRIVQNLGVRTAPAEVGAFSQRVDAVGSVQANEREIQVVQSRASGWVERLHVRAVSDPVKRGQLLAEVYAPDLLAAQEEFLLALNMGNDRLTAASRARLSLLGLNNAQISRLEKTREPQRRVAFYSPLNGIVAELGVREGMEVAMGTAMFNLVDLSTVWVVAEIPETQAAWINEGSSAEIRIPTFPGKVFKGRVDYIYPRLDKTTRTLEARVVLKNPDLKLKPGMYVDVGLEGEKIEGALTVPTEAVIRTGRRTVVILALGEGKFKPVEVTTGFEAEGKTQILDGLEKGQSIVASGQFLIDSTSSLRTALDRLTTPESTTSEAASPTAQPQAGADSMKGMMERNSMEDMTGSDSMKGAGNPRREMTGPMKEMDSMKETKP